MSKKINKIIQEKKYGVVCISSKKSNKNQPVDNSIYLTFILEIGKVENRDDLIGIAYGLSIKNSKDKLKPRIGKKIALKRLQSEPNVIFLKKSEIEKYKKVGINFSDILPLFLVLNIKNSIEKNEFKLFKNTSIKNKSFRDFYLFLINYIDNFNNQIKKYLENIKNNQEKNKE